MTYYTFNGGGGQAPKGGVIVADRVAGIEKEYKGGQFLPQTTPPLNSKQKKALKTVLARLSDVEGQQVKKSDIHAVSTDGETRLYFCIKNDGCLSNCILDFRNEIDAALALSSFDGLVIDENSYSKILTNY